MTERRASEDGDGRHAAPLDAADPRFAGSEEAAGGRRVRTLVESKGPGASPEHPSARALRILLPVAFALGILAVVTVFAVGLNPGDGNQVVGPEAAVRAAVAERPRRVCYRGTQPCAWLSLVDGELLAFNTNGPLPEEFGRLGIAWCASSGYFGSNVTGSRYDPRGNLARGPAPRGLDRFRLTTDDEGLLRIDFSALTTGLQVELVDEVLPPEGADCEEIPFDREADLDLDSNSTSRRVQPWI